MSRTRHCKQCGLVAPPRLTYEWDLHLTPQGTNVFSCSDECRAAMGYKRRKPRIAAKTVTVQITLDFADLCDQLPDE